MSRYIFNAASARKTLVSAGGKGINVARALQGLGAHTLATGIIGGVTGREIKTLLKKEYVPCDFMEIKEESRTNLTFKDHLTKDRLRILGAGPMVQEGDLVRFEKKLSSLLKRASTVAFCGRNAQGAPKEYYARLIKMAKRIGVITALDTSGQDLIEGLKAKPRIIKPNLNEAQDVLGMKLTSLKKIKTAIKDFHRQGIHVVLMTLGEQGAVGGLQGEIWHCRTPKVKMRQELGCGDSFLAGYLFAAQHGNKFPDALRFATSCGTINGEGRVPGDLDPRHLKPLISRARLKRLS